MNVWFRDAIGNTGTGPNGNALVKVTYKYSFFNTQVKAWMSVNIYARASGGALPFVKEPKFAMVVTGGGYKRVAVFRDDTYITGTMRGEPEPDDPSDSLNTEHSAWGTRNRVQWDFATTAPKPSGPGKSILPTPVSDGCGSPDLCFEVSMRAMATTRAGDVLRNEAPRYWERTRAGLDRWAERRFEDPELAVSYPRDTRGDGVVSRCGAPGAASGIDTVESIASENTNPGRDSVRRWEIGGFKSTVAGENNEVAFTRSFVYFTGWEGGRGPTDCEPLQVDFSRAPGAAVRSYGAYAIYSFRDCFCE
jgi:hypothetical protein